MCPQIHVKERNMSLSDTVCRNAKAKEKPYKLFDSGGLYLEVSPTGQRYWRLKYRIFNKEKRIALGIYPATSLVEAREEREKAKKLIKNHIDPSAERQEQKRIACLKATETFQKVAEDWHKHHYDSWSKKHADNILHRMKMDVFPRIGHYPISKLSAPVILSCLQKIEERGAQELARRALQMCGQVFRYAVVTGRAERDITPDLRGSLKKANKSHFAAIEIDELPKLLKKLHINERRLFRQTILLIRMMLLTFVRTSELIEATWDEINLEKAEWVIPAERMKMRKAHIVPLSEQVLSIIRELKEMNGNRHFIFPSIVKPLKPMSNGTILMALDRMGYRNKMTGHGFRALAMSTIKEKLGYQHEVVDRQLAHAPVSSVDRAYDRAKFLPQRKQMMQDWADYIDALS